MLTVPRFVLFCRMPFESIKLACFNRQSQAVRWASASLKVKMDSQFLTQQKILTKVWSNWRPLDPCPTGQHLILVELSFDAPNQPAVIEVVGRSPDRSVRAMCMPARALAPQPLRCVLGALV